MYRLLLQGFFFFTVNVLVSLVQPASCLFHIFKGQFIKLHYITGIS